MGLLGSTAAAAVLRPWIGVVVAYFIVILAPQAVWWWAFDGLRPALWVTLPTLAGVALAAFQNHLDLKTLANRRTVFFILLWAFFFLSYIAGPYNDVPNPARFAQPAWAMSQANKILLLYFVACLCIDSEKKVNALSWAIIVAGLYLIYWANDAYLSGNAYGRLRGPTGIGSGSNYTDENNFSMVFVVVIPFLWNIGLAVKSHVIRYGLWLAIPLGWHAVFLTGSRGGLVGIGVTLMLTAWRSKNKALAFLLLPAFIGAYFWQAGDVMRERATTISSFQEDQSASSRLISWRAALEMMADHPITGVGMTSFSTAFPSYSRTEPLEAHSTFFQIAAESGVIAGAMYAFVVLACLFGLWRNGKKLRQRTDRVRGPPTRLYAINEATLISFSGLVVCSLFLSLQLFEIFYCLCVVANAVLFVSAKELESAATETPTEQQTKRQSNRAGRGLPVVR